MTPDATSGSQPEPIQPETASDCQNLGQLRRQSTLAPLFIAFKLLRRIGLVQYGFALAAILSGRLWIIPVLMAVVVMFAVTAIVNWWRFTFQLVGDELIVHRGVLEQQRTVIPLDRVQSVSTDQQLLHRVLGLVRARIDTAGTALDELVIDAVDVSVADSIRRVAATHTPVASTTVADPSGAAWTNHATTTGGLRPGPTPAAAEPVLLQRTVGDLVKVAFGRNPGPALALPLALFFSAGELLDMVGIDVFDSDIDPSIPQIVLIVFGAVVVAIGGWILRTINRFHDLTLRRTPQGFRSTAGLLERRERASAISRIQMVRSSQNIVERWFSIATVRLPPASVTAGSDAGGDTINLPGTTATEFDALLDEIIDPHARPRSLDRGIAPAAALRWMLWIGLVPMIAATVGIALRMGWWAVLAPLWLAAVVPLAVLTQRRWRWGLAPQGLAVSHGLLTTSTTHVALRKAQSVQLERGIFHRRNGLASVVISTAGGNVSIPHLVLADAEELRDRVLHRVEIDQGSWM